MKADQWAGLVTKASPYILPPGAGVEQVNLSTAIPGQMTTRDGMRRVVGTEDVPNVLDCFAFDFGGQSVIAVMLPDGSLAVVNSPAYGPETTMPSEPVFGIQAGQTGATYTNRYVIGPASETVPPAPSPSPYRDSIGGGGASSSSWTATVAGGATVTGSTTSNYSGGTPATPDYPPVLLTLP